MKENEIHIQGVAISEGIAFGRPHIIREAEADTPDFPISRTEVDAEIARYRQAIFSSKEDLFRLQKDLAMEGSQEAVTFIETHIQMLEDPMITTHMEEKIRVMLRNTESVFDSVIADYKSRFSKRSSPVYQERLVDVTDISDRILSHLQQEDESTNTIPTGSVIIGREVVPSFMAAAHAAQVSAFVTERGGSNSHAALIARSKGLPFVSGIGFGGIAQEEISLLIVDGFDGRVILNPSADTIGIYREKQKQAATRYQRLLQEDHLPAETIDGQIAHLFVNVEDLDDLERFSCSHSGVGLFRTEYLFLDGAETLPTEEAQAEVYKKLISRAGDRPVVIRVFDLGGDKQASLPYERISEENPAMGLRGIRFLLRHQHLFQAQIRAIHLAAVGADVKILLPLISDISELCEAKELIEAVKEGLRSEHLDIPDLPLGCMIEVPSAALMCDALAAECDFLSLGTNDLIQYTLGVDRANPAMSELVYPAHPSLLRTIKMVTLEANKQGVPLSICGEIAANVQFTPLLFGLGLRNFSVAPRYLPFIKQAIRKMSSTEAHTLAERALSCASAEAVSKLFPRVI